MPGASYVQSSFIGGEVSKFTQGRYHDQKYRTWLDECTNIIPRETESVVRRPGFSFAGTTRQGLPGRVIKFDFQASAPYTMEFTDGHLRFWQASALTTTNDSVAVSSISTANPAVATLASAVTWATGDEGFFTLLGATCPLLQNRRFTLTKLSTTTFSLADSITGANIDGSTLGVGSLAATATLNRVLDLSTVYAAGQWSDLRSVQTDGAAFFLHSQFAPYELVIDTQPIGDNFATFSLSQSIFQDGPYLDPIPGSTVTPGATSGVTTLTLDFQPYVATQAYTIGAFVDSGSVGYQSLVDANVGNTPASSPTKWKVVGFGAAINNGQGFIASDIGRLVRLFSEPALWASGTTYGSGTLVSYNPSNIPGDETYWSSLAASNTGNVPGKDVSHWSLVAIGSTQNPALWTWGKITGLTSTGFISGTLAGTVHIGDMTDRGGLAAAFDSITSKILTSCAARSITNTGVHTAYVGQNYSGASAQTISQAVVYPSNDQGFLSGNPNKGTPLTINLRAKASAPSNSSDGTLLGSVTTTCDSLSPVTIVSNDTSTTWNYVWAELSANNRAPSQQFAVAQLQLFSASAAPGTAVNVEILGPPLLYSGVSIQTWRLGLYSDTTGWPNVGTYAEGRLWLASAGYPNRVDACVADGISGVNNGAVPGYVNFAPTDQYGNVTDANAFDYTFNAPDANPILWMIPDLQGMLCGTLSGEWIVQAPTNGGISPLNIVARRVTTLGSANIEPRRTEHTTVFAQRFLRKILEFFPDVFSGKFSAPDLTHDVKHLTAGGIEELAFQQGIVPTIWTRVNNGIIGATYRRDTLMTSSGPTMNGWYDVDLGSNRNVESIGVGSSLTGTLDSLFAVTNDPNANVRFIEVLSDIPEEGSLLSAATYLDAFIVPSSTSAVAVSNPNFPDGGLQLNGLWPLNGYTVTAWLGGLDLGDYTVANGSIQIAYGDGIGNGQGAFPPTTNRNDQGLFTQSFVNTGVTANGVTMWTGTMPMAVGFTYTSRAKILRPNAPQESGTRSGPAFAKKRRSHWIMGQFEGSQGVSWGTVFGKLKAVRFTQDSGAAYTVDQQFTGIVRDNLSADYNFDNAPCWQVTRPYICNVQAIGAALETQDI